MSAPMEENKRPSDNVMSNLMALNKLTYRTPPSLSIASQARYVENYPQQRTYGDQQTIVFNVNTGSQFLDAKNSYLAFNIAARTGGAAGSICDFGKGSAWNLVENVRVKSRSGTEICRVQGQNLLANVRHRYTCPKDAFVSSLQAEGYFANETTAGTDGTGNLIGAAAGLDVVLPLHWIPCFDQHGGKLLPPQLADGMIIEIDLASVGQAFIATGGNNPDSYTLSELKIRWKAFQIADAFARKVNEMSARDGLNLVHKEWYRTLTSANDTAYNYDVKKSASKALQVLVVPRASAAIGNIAGDSNECQANDLQQFQFQNSSTYYPNAPMRLGNGTSVPPTSCAEAYYYVLASWGRNHCNHQTDVSLINYSATPPSADTQASMGVASAGFCKSQVSDLAGIMINSARTLNCEVLFNNGLARRLDTWLCHARHTKVYQENCVVAD
jgi:hypothetical protein